MFRFFKAPFPQKAIACHRAPAQAVGDNCPGDAGCIPSPDTPVARNIGTRAHNRRIPHVHTTHTSLRPGSGNDSSTFCLSAASPACCRKLLFTSAFSLFSTPTHQAASENQHPPRFQRILSILVSSESEVCAGDGGVPFRTRKGVHLPFGIEPKLHVRRRGLKRKKLKAKRTSAISKPRRRINGYIYK